MFLVPHPQSSVSSTYIPLTGLTLSLCHTWEGGLYESLKKRLGKKIRWSPKLLLIHIIGTLIIWKSKFKISIYPEAVGDASQFYSFASAMTLFVTFVGSFSSSQLLMVEGTRTQSSDPFLFMDPVPL